MRFVIKLIGIAIAASLCWMLARQFGMWKAIAIWTTATAVACAIAALLLKSTHVGELTWKNRIAGLTLQWGYAIARGRLPGIAITSWLVWTLIGGLTIWDFSRRAAGQSGFGGFMGSSLISDRARSIILIIEWSFNVAAILFAMGAFAKQNSRSYINKSLLQLIAILILLTVGSMMLWKIGWPNVAILVAGPPIYMGLIYGGFVAVVLIFGRNIRWN